MRNFNQNDKWDVEEAKKLNAEQWQIDCLALNPDYTFWGNYEDYMCDKSGNWSSPIELDSFGDLWELDDLNEVVNFYFFIERESHDCPCCQGTGLNAETFELQRAWYDFEGTGKRWCDKLTESEVNALWEAGRLHYDFTTKPTVAKVNSHERERHLHDAINKCICVEQRAKDLGVYGRCENDGCVDGVIYDEPSATLKLQLWFILPRKGASRGVIVNNITKEDVPKVIDYLRNARERNHNRFSKL